MEKEYTEEAKIRFKTLGGIFMIFMGIVAITGSIIIMTSFSKMGVDDNTALSMFKAPNIAGIIVGIGLITLGIKTLKNRKNVNPTATIYRESIDENDESIKREIEHIKSTMGEDVNIKFKKMNPIVADMVVIIIAIGFAIGAYFSFVSLREDIVNKSVEIFTISKVCILLLCLFVVGGCIYALIYENLKRKKSQID